MDWNHHQRQLGEVFGRPDEIEAAIADYEWRVDDLGAALGDRRDELEVTYIRIVERLLLGRPEAAAPDGAGR